MMDKNSIKEMLLKQSKKDTEWIVEAKERVANEDDLDIAFAIAVKIISIMKVKKMSQRDLASLFDVTPQYVSKLLKGKENLSISTANKYGKLLGIKLLEVPQDYQSCEGTTFSFVIEKTDVLKHTSHSAFPVYNFSERELFRMNFTKNNSVKAQAIN